jgi:hypothetical protein
MFDQTSLRTRASFSNSANGAERLFETLEGRQFFSASIADDVLVASPSTESETAPAVIVAAGEAVENPLVGTWGGALASDTRQVMSVTFAVKEINEDGTFNAQVTIADGRGNTLVASAQGGMTRRGFVVAWNDGKTFFGRLSGSVVPEKGIDAQLEFSSEGRSTGGALALQEVG